MCRGLDDDVLTGIEMPSSQVQPPPPPPPAAAPPLTPEDAFAEQFGALDTAIDALIAAQASGA